MGKKRVIGKQEPDEISKYKSPNTGEYVMASQYIAEIIVNRKADTDGVRLELKYWNNPDNKYSKEFKSQVSQAAKLLKKYRSRSIVSALNELKWCFSLRNQTFLAVVAKKEAILLKSEEEAAKKTIEVSNPNKVSKAVSPKKSMLAKLKAINNGKEEEIGRE